MAIIPLLRLVVFSLIIVFSLVVLGICAYIEYLVAGYPVADLTFVPLGIAVSCLTIISLSVFLLLGSLRHGVFTSMILFEIIWFFLLWLIWVGTAGDSIAEKSLHFPEGCIYTGVANQYCQEFTAVEAFSFLNFFLAFVYYDVVFLYAIINAVRGRSIWTSSVKEAANITSAPVNLVLQYPTSVQHPPAPGTPYQNYGQFPQQPYGAPLPQQGYPQQVPPQGAPMVQQPYNYPPSPGAPQQQPQFAGYVPPVSSTNLPPPQPNYGTYPTSGPQTQLPLPSGYQEQPVQQPLQPQPPYSSPHVIHV